MLLTDHRRSNRQIDISHQFEGQREQRGCWGHYENTQVYAEVAEPGGSLRRMTFICIIMRSPIKMMYTALV